MIKVQNKKKIALVLSGGGIKAAAFHIGVCLALQEKGFKFAGGSKNNVEQKFQFESNKVINTYVGSSAGSFVATLLASGYSLESLISAFKLGNLSDLLNDPNDPHFIKPFSYQHVFNFNFQRWIHLLPNMVKNSNYLFSGAFETYLKHVIKLDGLFRTTGIENYLRKHVLIDDDFAKLGSELYIIATELNHSRKVIFGNFSESKKDSHTRYINYASISQAVACSTSLPPVFSPYGLKTPKGKIIYYYDGEIRETLSAHVAADQGADLVISSYSVQPYHYNEELGSLHEYGIPVILNQALYQVIQQKIEKHIYWQNQLADIYSVIDSYFKQNNLPIEHKNKLLEIFTSRSQFRPDVDHIYINPRPQNHEMFFVDHFSLNPKILEKIVKIGFKSAISELRKHSL